MRYFIRYGRKHLSIDIDARRVVGILSPKAGRRVKNVGLAVRAALQRPIASVPLGNLLKGKRTALIATVDNTRPSPRELILPVLETCHHYGVTASIIIANGRHRPMTKHELARHLGTDLLESYAVLQHDPFDDALITKNGYTSRGTPIWVNQVVFNHDIVIAAGIIEPSYLCGWSGGRKILMPGLAHHQSIDNNHFFLTCPETKIGRLAGNPVSEDAAEFAARLPLHFILYAVVGPDDEFVKIVAGHPVKAHKAGCAWGQRMYSVAKKEADIVISSAGGAPYDCNLVQGKKAVIPAFEAVGRNGVVILCAECPDGIGAEQTFLAWLKNKMPAEVARDVLDRSNFCLGAHGANILARPIVQKNAKVILVTNAAVARQLRGTYVTALTKLSDAWDLANLITGKDSRVLLIEKARRLILH